MPRFFTGWETWEKLTFCLAGAILLTFFAGATKVGYTHWRLRKYTAIAEKERKEQMIQRQVMHEQPFPAVDDEIPFGIRALESGVEVEGIWVSRPTTPDSKSQMS
ncbi:hypothetical protein K470DRAFT_212062, partial [Piedraia hortae CBS 480.64]